MQLQEVPLSQKILRMLQRRGRLRGRVQVRRLREQSCQREGIIGRGGAGSEDGATRGASGAVSLNWGLQEYGRSLAFLQLMVSTICVINYEKQNRRVPEKIRARLHPHRPALAPQAQRHHLLQIHLQSRKNALPTPSSSPLRTPIARAPVHSCASLRLHGLQKSAGSEIVGT